MFKGLVTSYANSVEPVNWLRRSSAPLDRFQHLQVHDPVRLDLHRVLGQDHEVGELPDLDRTLPQYLTALVRSVDGEGLQSFGHADPLLRANHVAATRLPGHAGERMHGKQRRDWLNWEIADFRGVARASAARGRTGKLGGVIVDASFVVLCPRPAMVREPRHLHRLP